MTITARLILLGFTALTPKIALAQALPSGGSYAAGSGTIATTGSAMTVTQSSARGVVNWQGFSIAAGHSVQFENGNGATLNRVTGAQMSTLQGHLGATGSLYLINPNGVVVGPKGTVTTGGSFVASTRDTADGAFMKGGTLSLSGNSEGTVKNEGKITSTNGNIVLVGQSVTNAGSLNAAKGTVALAAGNKIVLSEAEGPSGIYVETDSNAKGDVTNTGHLQAAAATLAAAGGNVYALAGNRDGLIEATGTQSVHGEIWLTAPHGIVTVENTTMATTAHDGSGGAIRANGRDVKIGGKAVLDASATKVGKEGGQILVGTDAKGGVNLARRTTLTNGATLTAKGKAGGAGGDIETSAHTLDLGNASIDAGMGGHWLLDPDDITIDSTAASTISLALDNGTNVTQQTTGMDFSRVSSTGSGDITLNAPLSWSGTGTLVLSAYRSVLLNADITVAGNGTLNLITNNSVGGTERGGTLALNSHAIRFPYRDNATNTGGALTINGNGYTLIASTADLQNVGSTGFFALAHPIDASSVSGFTPLGGATGFSGDFNGLGNTISNLTITSNASEVGLFGLLASGGTIENIGMLGGSVTSTGIYSHVGGLVGGNGRSTRSGGTITNAYATSDISATGGSSYVGGLVGFNTGREISNSYATGNVSASGLQSNLGGLVGGSFTGEISNVHAAGNVTGSDGEGGFIGGLVGENYSQISHAYATGDVTSNNGFAGGLAGYNGTDIDHAYATGNVANIGIDSIYSYAGGLMGYNDAYGTASNVYSTGSVTGKGPMTYVGGLVGFNASGTVSSAYATGSVSGVFRTGGLAGRNEGIFTNAYWDTQTAGETGIGSGPTLGTAGRTTAELQASLPAGFNRGSWDNAGNQTTPYLPSLDGNQVFSVNDHSSALYTVVMNVAQLQALQNTLGGRFVLGNAIDASGVTDFAPIAAYSTAFTGTLDGLGYTINNLVISSDAPYVGLIGQLGSGGIVRNIGMLGGSVSGTNTYALSSAGGLVAVNDHGQIMNAYTTGNVTATSVAGGLVAYNQEGSITNAYATGNVRGNFNVGGLVGAHYTSLFGQEAKITNAYATGSVSDSGRFSYAYVGGLVGNSYRSSIINTYATGRVTALGHYDYAYIGGLIGNDHGTVRHSFWDKTTSGQDIGVGGGYVDTGPIYSVTGLTTSEWLTKGPMTSGTPAGFTDPSAWVAGSPHPVLSVLPYIVIQAHDATQVYGTSTPTISGVTYTDQHGIDAGGRIFGTIAWQNPLLSSTSVAGSSGALYGTGAKAAGYQIAYRVTNTITPATLNITANNQSGLYGQSPALGTTAFTTDGLVNGDRVTAVDLTTEATASSPAGLYPILASNAAGTGLKNYSILYHSALLDITAALTPAPVIPEPVAPSPTTPAPVTPDPVTPEPTAPPASVMALARISWPTPVTALANVSFVRTLDTSENRLKDIAGNTLLPSEQIIGTRAHAPYRITVPAPSIINQIRKAQ